MNIKDLIADVRAHDVSANPGPWRTQICVESDLIGTHSSITGNGYLLVDDAEHADAALIAHYRTAAPLLADEVERLDAENATLHDNLKHVEHALGDRVKPGQTPERAIAEMLADMDRMAVQLEDAGLTLAADKDAP